MLCIIIVNFSLQDYISFYTSSRQNRDFVPYQNNQQHTGSSLSKPTAAPTTESTSLSSSPQQSLFPPHCIAESEGARLIPPLENAEFNFYIKKGRQREVESFSAFADAQGHSTGLGEWLHEHNVDSIAIAGVAIEYCVLATALDALLKWDFAPERVAVVANGVAGVNAGAALHALQEIRRHGGVVMMWDEILHDWIQQEIESSN